MGTIISRPRKDGKPSYLAHIAKQAGGKVVRENRTFRDHKTAKAWLRQRETELDNPKAFRAATQQVRTLGDAIGRYLDEHRGEIGKTRLLASLPYGATRLPAWHAATSVAMTSSHFARTISTVTGLVNPGPSTVNNYISPTASPPTTNLPSGPRSVGVRTIPSDRAPDMIAVQVREAGQWRTKSLHVTEQDANGRWQTRS